MKLKRLLRGPLFWLALALLGFVIATQVIGGRGGFERVDTSLEGGIIPPEKEPPIEPLGDRVRMLVQEGRHAACTSLKTPNRECNEFSPLQRELCSSKAGSQPF